MAELMRIHRAGSHDAPAGSLRAGAAALAISVFGDKPRAASACAAARTKRFPDAVAARIRVYCIPCISQMVRASTHKPTEVTMLLFKSHPEVSRVRRRRSKRSPEPA
jgi:hypothetical protein